mmetsp:Transcript_24078/g.39208  ORF Transcript_24078/g.39208 Transcript_24078/m.39208 type:complete len:283 (-) Transcript_24078:365-1213(-)
MNCSSQVRRPAHIDTSSSGCLASINALLVTASACSSFTSCRLSTQRWRKVTCRAASACHGSKLALFARAFDNSGATRKSRSRFQKSVKPPMSFFMGKGSPSLRPVRQRCRVLLGCVHNKKRSSLGNGSSKRFSLGTPRNSMISRCRGMWIRSFAVPFFSFLTTVQAGGRKSISMCWYSIPAGNLVLVITSTSSSTMTRIKFKRSWSQASPQVLPSSTECVWLAASMREGQRFMLMQPPCRSASSAVRGTVGSVKKLLLLELSQTMLAYLLRIDWFLDTSSGY